MGFKKLYRRGNNFVNEPGEVAVTSGVLRNITFPTPGWVAFDFYAKVANDANGRLGQGEFFVKVDGDEKASYRASWPWTRHYVFVDEGVRTIEFNTRNYQAGDEAKIRFLNCTEFPELQIIEAIELAKPPQPLEEMIRINILNGSTRYQSTSERGCQVEMQLIFKGTTNYHQFMKGLTSDYILKGEEGMYGGVLLPQSLEQVKKGKIYLVKCVLHSPALAGVGH
ncbi:hypothetical protein LC040_12115 [Bacillus tianshenii]|nr:hypothetical protein LC040_12115 [Bacillus tianshenii]